MTQKQTTKENASLLKILFGGMAQNMMLLTFFIALVLFGATLAFFTSEDAELSGGARMMLYGTGLTMIAVLVVLPFSLYTHMTQRQKK